TRVVITGTPVENNTFDLYGQLSFACPGLLGNKQYFKEIYAVPIDQFADQKRAKELREKVRPFILRRTKEQVAAELPEKTEMVLFCDMPPAQQQVYNAIEQEFRDYICSKTGEELPRHTVHVLKGLTRLRQVCNSPLLLKEEDIAVKESGKMTVLMEQIHDKSPHHKILVFSQFVSMLELVKKELNKQHIGFSYLTGSTRDRGRVVKEFQEDTARRVFLISLKAGGTGLNLTQADYVYLIDPWWNPAVENQAIDRIHRIGQQKHVVAVRLICAGTIEEKIMRLQETKRELFGKLVTKDSLLELLGPASDHSSYS
ncbi:MAG TPA: DEAD/DEAH box helicase, partial [Anseongella sp.]